MKQSLLLSLILFGSYCLAQDLKSSDHGENLSRPKVQTQQGHQAADGGEYKDEYFDKGDLRALGAGSALVLNKEKLIEIPARSKLASIGGGGYKPLGETYSGWKSELKHSWFEIECYLVMRDADDRTRQVSPGQRIIIGAGPSTKVKSGSKFSVDVPVESPASIQSIRCISWRVEKVYNSKDGYLDGNPPKETNLYPADPKIGYLKDVFEQYGELVQAKPLPVE